MKTRMMMVAMVAAALLPAAAAQADVFHMTGGKTSLELVTVGNPGNNPDVPGGHGEVDYTFKMGTFEVTTAQYCEFLNAAAKTSDPYGLYNTAMWTNDLGCKIQRTGTAGNFSYTVPDVNRVNRPVNYVGYWDAVRFANWLTNGQGAGNTEDGSYFINGYNGPDGQTIVRKVTATYVVPSQDEWYKAAYHKNDGPTGNYWQFPTESNTAPTAEAPAGADLVNGSANYLGGSLVFVDTAYYYTKVGAYTAKPSDSPYGTYDQGGNLCEWDEALVDISIPGLASRQVRGGCCAYDFTYLRSDTSFSQYPSWQYEDEINGFRVALVPEPATLSLLALGGLAILRRRRRN